MDTTHDGPRQRQRGASGLTATGSLAITLGLAALVVDTGHLLVTQAELQATADLAAASGARELGRVFLEEGREDPASDRLSDAERLRITSAANYRSERNSAGQVPISVVPGDVEFGRWNDSNSQFIRTTTGVTAVRVTTRRDDVANGRLPALLARVFGRDDFALQATAGARLSGIRYLPPGKADFPVGIAKAWFSYYDTPCAVSNSISFYPTGTPRGCAGWHTFTSDPSNAAKLRYIIEGLREGTYLSPEVRVDETEFIFTGGTVDSALEELAELYDHKKNAAGEMAVLIPVYDRDDCSNPSGPIRIIGMARAVITGVSTSGWQKHIDARVQCDVIDYGQGPGTDYGTLVAYPDLVE
jgi:hypothetical protein